MGLIMNEGGVVCAGARGFGPNDNRRGQGGGRCFPLQYAVSNLQFGIHLNVWRTKSVDPKEISTASMKDTSSFHAAFIRFRF